MEIPSICRYCGGKIIKSTTRALYPKGREPIYLCVNCNAYPKQLEDLGLDCVILAPSMLEPLPERMPAEDGRLLSLTCFYDSDCGCNAQTLALSNDMGLVLRKMREDLDTYEIPVVLSHVERLIDGYRFSYEAKDAGVESLYLSYTISGVPVFLQQPAGHT